MIIKPLLVYLQPKDLPEVLIPLSKIPIDKLYIKYHTEKQAFQRLHLFIDFHWKEYTHLVLFENDIIVRPDDFRQLICDIEEYPFLDIISGVMNVDMDENKDYLACTTDLPNLQYPRVMHWIPKENMSIGIHRIRHAGFSLVAIKTKMLFHNWILKGFDKNTEGDIDADLYFSHECAKANIPMYVDSRICLTHLRYKGKMMVGIKEPEMEFVPWAN